MIVNHGNNRQKLARLVVSRMSRRDVDALARAQMTPEDLATWAVCAKVHQYRDNPAQFDSDFKTIEGGAA